MVGSKQRCTRVLRNTATPCFIVASCWRHSTSTLYIRLSISSPNKVFETLRSRPAAR
uniref:Uncharacterized protein n=1 Tax=Coccidioides posadasii RMSCC 3488 TaxID=454284 RepID=A0A0J6FAZ9_COCPO|nr:hypothetical protein CPAG_06498 [Coccidioides posadasii RMSCC 3488]